MSEGVTRQAGQGPLQGQMRGQIQGQGPAAMQVQGEGPRPPAWQPPPARVLGPHEVLTERLLLRPVAARHAEELVRLKGDEAAFGLMLGGVRGEAQARTELEADIAFWARHGYGVFAVHEAASDAFLGIAGLMDRPDGRGIALRFALWPAMRGKGYAREAARAAVAFGHAQGLPRIIAVARETNLASRAVLADLGFTPADEFRHQGHRMLVFESLRPDLA